MELLDYASKLHIAGSMLTAGLKASHTQDEEHEIYLNIYNLLRDFIEEFAESPLSLGQRIPILHKILNSEITRNVLSYISRNAHCKVFKNIYTNGFCSDIFSKMLDAYLICERDSESTNMLFDVMHHNIYLYDFNCTEFLLAYPDILKNIYEDDLTSSLKSLCAALINSNDQSLEINLSIAKLLTYLSAALELPDVYLYSKKLNLDLSIMKKDYFQASGLIKDLEYMHYNSNEMKYYKALIKQRSVENLKFGFH